MGDESPTGKFIVTRTGQRFYFDRPEWFHYTTTDIAPALANLCRFAGQMRWWSVAQHSLLVGALVPPRHRLRGLLHDASEAFLADIPSPLKHSPIMRGYRALEARTMAAIHEDFGLAEEDAEGDAEVKQADLLALRAEALYLGILDSTWSVWTMRAVSIPRPLLRASRQKVARQLTAAIVDETRSQGLRLR